MANLTVEVSSSGEKIFIVSTDDGHYRDYFQDYDSALQAYHVYEDQERMSSMNYHEITVHGQRIKVPMPTRTSFTKEAIEDMKSLHGLDDYVKATQDMITTYYDAIGNITPDISQMTNEQAKRLAETMGLPDELVRERTRDEEPKSELLKSLLAKRSEMLDKGVIE